MVQWKDIRPCPWRPELGLKEALVSGNNKLFGQWIWSSEAAMGGGHAAPRLAWQCAQKDGCAQRTGAHARPKPTSYKYTVTETFVFGERRKSVLHGSKESDHAASFNNQWLSVYIIWLYRFSLVIGDIFWNFHCLNLTLLLLETAWYACCRLQEVSNAYKKIQNILWQPHK